LEDFKRLNPGVKGLDRDLISIKHRVKHEGDGFLTRALPALDDALLEGLSKGRFTCPIGFKKIRGGAIPVFLQGMLSEIFDSKTGQLKEPIEYGILRDVHTLLRLFKKTRMSSDDEETLHNKAVNEFFQCDETAESVTITDRQDHLIGLVGRSILLTLNHKDPEDENIYRHGPGAVQESYKGNQKWAALYSELRDFAHVPEWFGTTNFYFPHDHTRLTAGGLCGGDPRRSHVLRRTRDTGSGSPEVSRSYRITQDTPVPQAEQRDGESSSQLDSSAVRGSQRSTRRREERLDPDHSARHRGASARLISVLKNSTSRRTITIEPFLRQYLQQGLNTILRESITECGILRNCLALSDQSLNQKLALEGSLSRKWATIDLKSASDLLSQRLVKSVFRHHPNFLEWMMDSRSPWIHTGGSNEPDVLLGKFAGMGNATTFPVQSICFAVVCIAAIMDNLGTKPNYRRVERASRLIRVYGDDIIVHSDHAHQVVKWLHDVGLKVNVKKSFLEGNFRESCGVEAFRGVDITPLYIRHWPHNIAESPSVCAHLVSLSNHMWMQGLYSASNYLKETVEKFLGRTLPLVSSQSGSLGWHTRLEAVQPHKWCTRTHQFLTRTFALKPVKSRDKLDGNAALLKCLTTPLLGRDKDHLERTARRFQHRLVQRWVPSYSYDGLNLQV
jgi:hypothetical protein